MRALKHGELSQKIIAAAYNVHKELGQGFLEKVYKNALAIELREMGLTCDRKSSDVGFVSWACCW
jgi:GxxExxY protein